MGHLNARTEDVEIACKPMQKLRTSVYLPHEKEEEIGYVSMILQLAKGKLKASYQKAKNFTIRALILTDFHQRRNATLKINM